jgi:hypothetical protein
MMKALELTMLPARQGDALWIRWGDNATPHQMIIDMGTEETGRLLRRKLETLPAELRKLDLLVVTHVDQDHIGGVLTCLAEADPLPGFEIGDVWFNGFAHLNGGRVTQPKPADSKPHLEVMGPAQGERLAKWLNKQTWNKQFGGGPVCRDTDEASGKIVMYDGLTLTILGPTASRLSQFIPTWKDEVEEALEKGTLTEVSPGLEALGPEAPLLEDVDDLENLAEAANSPDRAYANGTSISLLLEYGGRKIILAGDAFPDDLLDGIKAASQDHRLRVDAFKLPHHGSRNNVMRPLVEAVECDRWLFSTDGTRFRHPDAVAVARIIAFSSVRDPLLAFNVPSVFNGWWNNEDWKSMFHYKTLYGTKEDGLLIAL